MNKKGFTMIELLATIIILGIVSTIGVVSVNKYVTQSREKSYKLTSAAVYEAAENCVIKGSCTAPTTSPIFTDYLITNGFLKKLNNPLKNRNDCIGDVSIYENGTSDTEYKKYYYEVHLDCDGYANTTLVWPYSKTADVSEYIRSSSSNVSDYNDEFMLKLGDYVSIKPTKTTYTISSSLTGYTSDQTINPSELNLWRIININDDGSRDAVSEYVSSKNVYFKGTTGYANFVGGLQTIAANYSKTGYTIGTRIIGYGGQTATITDTSAFDGSTTTTPSTRRTGSPVSGIGEEYSNGILGDTLYLKDYLLVSNVYKSDTSTYGTTGLKAYKVTATSTATSYWLASRYFDCSNIYFYFNSRSIYTGGRLSDDELRAYGGSGWRSSDTGAALRPIITIKSGVMVSGGSGTKDSPYTLK